jgi:hypothetical protein
MGRLWVAVRLLLLVLCTRMVLLLLGKRLTCMLCGCAGHRGLLLLGLLLL